MNEVNFHYYLKKSGILQNVHNCQLKMLMLSSVQYKRQSIFLAVHLLFKEGEPMYEKKI